MELDEIKRQVDLRVFVAGLLNGGQHKTAYDQYHCPFHRDNRSPSFTVWSDHFYCFGCELGGSILDFVMQYEHCSLREAAQKLEEKMTFQKFTPPPTETKKKDVVIPLSVVQDNFSHISLGLPYFEKRQITDPTAHREKLGVKINFKSYYTLSTGERIEFYSHRYAIPNIFDNRVRAINYRRNDSAFMDTFDRHPKKGIVLADLEQLCGHSPTKDDILAYCSGEKYKQEYGSTWKPFNVQLIKRREGKEIVNVPQRYVLIHAETKEFDSLALSDLGLPTVGVRLTADLFSVIPSLFSHIPMLYIVRDNDDPGLKKAVALQECLGRGRIISPPKEYKDTGETAMDGMALKWAYSYGLEPTLGV